MSHRVSSTRGSLVSPDFFFFLRGMGKMGERGACAVRDKGRCTWARTSISSPSVPQARMYHLLAPDVVGVEAKSHRKSGGARRHGGLTTSEVDMVTPCPRGTGSQYRHAPFSRLGKASSVATWFVPRFFQDRPKKLMGQRAIMAAWYSPSIRFVLLQASPTESTALKELKKRCV